MTHCKSWRSDYRLSQSSALTRSKDRKDPNNVLTDVVISLLHSVSLQEVVSQHKSPGLHGVEEQGSRMKLLTGGQFSPRFLSFWMQQIIHGLHHGLGQQQRHRGHKEEMNIFTTYLLKECKSTRSANNTATHQLLKSAECISENAVDFHLSC